MTGPNRSTAVIIPVKGENPKGRLSPLLSPAQRRQLQIAMLEDTLQTLIKARMIGQTFVVSSDPQILEFVRGSARARSQKEDAGVTAAVIRGLEATASYGVGSSSPPTSRS